MAVQKPVIPRTDRYWKDRTMNSLMHLCDAEHFQDFQTATMIRADLRERYGMSPEEVISAMALTMNWWKPPIRMEAETLDYVPYSAEGHDVVRR